MSTLEIKTKSERRLENVKILSALSQTLRNASDGDFETTNQLLENYYREDLPESIVFKSFNQWKKEGKTVKKGEHGFLFWGRPINKNQDENTQEEGLKVNEKFFPLCYLFASHQVTDKNNN